MPETLLRTKFFRPPSKQWYVPRPQLIVRINRGLQGKLTLVSAPAGYGKTTLIATGLSQAAWLSLDTGDNDPARFWSYVFAALRDVKAELGEDALAALASPQPPPIEALLTNLINRSTTFSKKHILVLDDYHNIDNKEIHQAISFLLDHLPPQLHLVIVSRSDPPLNLARMRGQGQSAELREADLRFTADETKAFFRRVADLRLSADSVAALHRRTEGWAVGLQLASLAMQGREDTAEFVQAFAGDHSYIIDYLTEEVFRRQSPAVQTFLLESSVLDRLSASLCDVMMADRSYPQQNGQAMLEYLNQQNLFLVPLDDRRGWYRYHHFFADILRYRLQQTQPELVPELHRRASGWFAANDFVADALHHAMAAGDFNRAADLIESVTRPMIGSGKSRTVQAWIEALPESLVRLRPLLCVSLAWVYNLNQAVQAIEPLLHDAEKALDNRDFDQETVDEVRGNVALLRGYAALQQNDPQLALQRMEESLAILPEDDVYLRSLVSFTQGVVYKRGGIWRLAATKLKQATEYGRVSSNLSVAIANRVHLIEMLITQGQLRQAASFCDETIAYHLAAQSNPVPNLGFVYSKLGEILFEWNDLEAAKDKLEHGLALAEKLMVAWSWTRDGLVYLARLRQLQGQTQAAQEYIERAILMSGEMQDLFDRTDLTFWQARLWLAQGNLTAALGWARDYQANTEARSEAADVVLARIFLAQRQAGQALGILAPICDAASAAGRRYAELESLALLAIAYTAEDDPLQAQTLLARALSLAEPEGFIRLFVGEGFPIAALLRELAARPDDTLGGDYPFPRAYVTRLLTALPAVEEPVSMAVAERGILNEREIQVLRLMATGLKTPEIAERLFLSNNTVKWHCRNLYSKLGVHSKAEAIAEGHRLGLLQ